MALTLGEKSRLNAGVTSGFDYLRLGLALAVMAWHAAQVSYNINDIASGLTGHFVIFVLPLFFALSGFLVTASLLRARSLKNFIMLRVLRIFPALCGEVLLSALLIGPLFTTVSLGEYFSGAEFASYFLNLIGDIHYYLPGVFADNPVERSMNASLWTVPYELDCYIALALLSLAGLARQPKLFLGLLAAFLAVFLLYLSLAGVPFEPRGATVSGVQLVLSFLAGCLLYLGRDKVPHHWCWLLYALALAWVTIRQPVLSYIAPLPVAYIAAYVGLLTPRKMPVIFSSDYSYGIYLYAFPVQQAVSYLFPDHRTALFNFAVSIVPVCALAAMSWHGIEKPMLKLKKRFA